MDSLEIVLEGSPRTYSPEEKLRLAEEKNSCYRAMLRDLTPADLFALGLTGRPDSAARREKLLHRLGLPQHMNSKALLAMLNALHTPDEVAQMVEELEQSKEE